MNKCYTVRQYYILENKKFIIYSRFYYGEDKSEEQTYDNFSDFYNIVNEEKITDMWADTTFWGHKKCVKIADGWDTYKTITEKNFVPITIGKEYKEYNPRINELTDLLTLDQFIEYAKNCGLMNEIDKVIDLIKDKG